jgi:DNA invertase Pin-like site-specific DNA recombinase
MAKSKAQSLNPAAAYLRKSTKGIRADGREKQERSLQQQREEVIKLARDQGHQIVCWYEDEGVSGWKREGARPGFARMLADARDKHAFRTIIVDDMDRFSRADVYDVVTDVRDLAKTGVEVIISVKGERFNIHDATDPGMMHTLVASSMANHAYSLKLSRRVTLSVRNRAKEAIRNGGTAPYAMLNDGKGGLRRGHHSYVKVIQWLFDQVGNHGRSLNSLAADLNSRDIPGPGRKVEGEIVCGKWYVNTIAYLLRKECYKGDFALGKKHAGQFHGFDESGEVVPSSKLQGPGHIFRKEGVYKKPIVDPVLWDKVQKVLDSKKDRSLRKRMGYALSGILFCGHCQKPMYGTRQKVGNGKDWTYGPIIYRCSANHDHGSGSCGYHQAREDQLLPFIVKTLGEELKDIMTLRNLPPSEITDKVKERDEHKKELQERRDQLNVFIERGIRSLTDPKLGLDSRSKERLRDRLKSLWEEMDEVEAKLAAPSVPAGEFTEDELEALHTYWMGICDKLIPIPIDDSLLQDPCTDHPTILADPLKVNAALRQLGAKVTLRWETEKRPTIRGKNPGKAEVTRHILTRGRFRLGQQQGRLLQYVLSSTPARAIRSPSKLPCCARC